ncbi:MAG: hypothetical protein A2V70_14750 [Planctomycetes bacterium RBG_13_63_9]|nr:MAG: hypothetical protein A2V70_14750 [Planctomycetes bacterium RBG_13_63_9]
MAVQLGLGGKSHQSTIEITHVQGRSAGEHPRRGVRKIDVMSPSQVLENRLASLRRRRAELKRQAGMETTAQGWHQAWQIVGHGSGRYDDLAARPSNRWRQEGIERVNQLVLGSLATGKLGSILIFEVFVFENQQVFENQ